MYVSICTEENGTFLKKEAYSFADIWSLQCQITMTCFNNQSCNVRTEGTHMICDTRLHQVTKHVRTCFISHSSEILQKQYEGHDRNRILVIEKKLPKNRTKA